VLNHILIGAALSIVVAAAAWRAHSLSAGGGIAAAVIGTLAVAAGWAWAGLLIAYFVVSSALSHAGRDIKMRRTSGIVGKTGARDGVQVLANGGVFAAAALFATVNPEMRWLALAAGALASSAADTWATELGTQFGAAPRSILTARVVPVGTSGGISAIGTVGAVAGACFVAAVAFALGWPPRIVGFAAVGGVVGAVVDSLLGASVQAARWCDTCARATERPRHDCGNLTRHVRGIPWLDNDAVNLLSGLAGGLLAAWLAG
jgi:uncharacterized protein (TIGR00297 family)